MKAFALEYRFRFALHAILYALGFFAPWLNIAALGSSPIWTTKTTWLVLTTAFAREGWLSFSAATLTVLVFALLMTGLGAWFRVWGSAYVGAGVVQSTAMHGESMLVDGPFRHTRNPLYLGTLLHTFGLAILMPPSGAIFTMATIWILQFRLALAEEPFLAAQFGQAYMDYAARVPRFLPVLAAQVPSAGAKPNWPLAVIGEIYFVGAFLTLLVFGWSFNADPIRRGFIISLGAWLIAIALIPGARKAPTKQPSVERDPTLLLPKTTSTRSFYDLLNLPQFATPLEIKEAYRKYAMRSHPDQNQDDPNAAEKFREISEAYQVLIDPVQREFYDAGFQ